MPRPGIEVLADRYYEALNAGNINAVVVLLDQDVVLTDGETQVVGKADVIARFITSFSSFATYAYSDARIESNSFFADHAYEVDPDRDTGIFPLAAEPIELVAQNGKITFINVGAAAAPAAPVPAAAPTPTAAAAEDAERLGALKRLAFDYWIAFNEYDVDKVLSYLEESYRAEREQGVTDEIAQLELFRVTLGVSERSAPALLSPTEGEMMLNLREPLERPQVPDGVPHDRRRVEDHLRRGGRVRASPRPATVTGISPPSRDPLPWSSAACTRSPPSPCSPACRARPARSRS